jgi:hypothetical protein
MQIPIRSRHHHVIPAPVFIQKHRFLPLPDQPRLQSELAIMAVNSVVFVFCDPTTHLLRICMLLFVTPIAFGSFETNRINFFRSI